MPLQASAAPAAAAVGPGSDQMRQFWQTQMQEVQLVGTDPAEFKNHQLPLARIKKVSSSALAAEIGSDTLACTCKLKLVCACTRLDFWSEQLKAFYLWQPTMMVMACPLHQEEYIFTSMMGYQYA